MGNKAKKFKGAWRIRVRLKLVPEAVAREIKEHVTQGGEDPGQLRRIPRGWVIVLPASDGYGLSEIAQVLDGERALRSIEAVVR